MNIESESLIVRTGSSLIGILPSVGEFALPGDKSLSHRAALLGAMADGESQYQNFQVSGVTQAMLRGLEKLGVRWELQDNQLRVWGIGLSPHRGKDFQKLGPFHLDCGNSATTMRLLAGALAAWRIPAVLDGSPGLRRRPMGRIIEPLREMGLLIESQDRHAPLSLKPSLESLHSIHYRLPVASAQVKSCLLLAGLTAHGETVLIEPGPSRDHTERMLTGMGISIERHQAQLAGVEYPEFVTRMIPPASASLKPLHMILPGDISAAAFLIVAALIVPGPQITLHGVGLNPTRTGLLDVLQEMGGDIQISHRTQQGGEPLGDLTIRHSELKAAIVEGDRVVRMIDEFPVFAVAAAYAHGQTVVRDAVELRHKESDRISALCNELSAIGVALSETPDGFIIEGGRHPSGGEVDPHGDHRLAMSLAVAGLAAKNPVSIQDANIISESFPNFIKILRHLGAEIV